MVCTKKSIVLTRIANPSHFRIESPKSSDTFSNALMAFSATSLYSKYCTFSQSVTMPSLLTRTEEALGRMSRMFVREAAAWTWRALLLMEKGGNYS